MNSRQNLGRLGENEALRFLTSQGYRLVERNFRRLSFEVDLIMIDSDTLVFVEVKSGEIPLTVTPEEEITESKLRKLRKAAEYYHLLYPNLPERLRVDFVGIVFSVDGKVKSLNHQENISY